MQFEDFYKTLGVPRDADASAIKQAYRRLARKYHPDVSEENDAEEQFKAVGQAYEVLSDPEKRAAYDELGANWQQGQDFQPPPGWHAQGYGAQFEDGYAETFNFRDFADLFRAVAGGSHWASQQLDLHAALNLTLEELYSGEPVNLFVRDPYTGREKTLRVNVPQNLRNGDSFRLKGQGLQAEDGRVGDLYVETRLAPHPAFEVRGDDVHSTLTLQPWQAALGDKVPVQTLGGRVMLTIPKGTNSGSKLRLQGKGLPGSPPGHHYVTVQIDLPTQLSAAEIALYEQLSEVSHA